jgi:hypothetical protein
LKLSEAIILRLNDLLVFACLDQGPKREPMERCYRLYLKKRYYVREVRNYLHLFKGSQEVILASHSSGGLREPYIYNSLFAGEDPFLRGSVQEEQKEGGGMTQDQVMTMEGMKMQLKNIYVEVVKEFDSIRQRVVRVIREVNQ